MCYSYIINGIFLSNKNIKYINNIICHVIRRCLSLIYTYLYDRGCIEISYIYNEICILQKYRSILPNERNINKNGFAKLSIIVLVYLFYNTNARMKGNKEPVNADLFVTRIGFRAESSRCFVKNDMDKIT